MDRKIDKDRIDMKNLYFENVSRKFVGLNKIKCNILHKHTLKIFCSRNNST